MSALPSYSREQAAHAIRARLAANAAANVDRIARLQLDGLSARLRDELALAEDRLSPKHLFNHNWRGPRLASLIADCEAAVRMGERSAAA